jgi:hypothetical protein
MGRVRGLLLVVRDTFDGVGHTSASGFDGVRGGLVGENGSVTVVRKGRS